MGNDFNFSKYCSRLFPSKKFRTMNILNNQSSVLDAILSFCTFSQMRIIFLERAPIDNSFYLFSFFTKYFRRKLYYNAVRKRRIKFCKSLFLVEYIKKTILRNSGKVSNCLVNIKIQFSRNFSFIF